MASVNITRRTRDASGRRRRETVFSLESDVGMGPAAYGRTTGGGRSAVVAFNGNIVRRYARHPGMKGKYPWKTAVRPAMEAANRHLYKGALVDGVKAAFN